MTARFAIGSKRVAPAAVALALLLPGALSGCGIPDRAETDSRVGNASDVATSGSTQTQDRQETGTSDAGGDSGDSGGESVLGSSTGQHPAEPGDSTLVPLRLDVTAVERTSGETVEVRFVIANTGSDVAYKPWDTLTASTWDVSGAAVLDLADDKRYLPLLDSEGACLCSRITVRTEIPPGASAEFYAQFPAPPEATEQVDFTLPGFKPVNGLEIG